MQLIVILVVFAAMLALSFAAFNFFGVKKMPEGTEKMSEIASAIRVGANAFIEYEYKVLYTVVAVVAVIMAVVTTWHAAVALLVGSIMSGCAGYIGMKIATYANVRVSNKARETKNIGETVKVAFRGGSVMGLCVGGFALLGLFLVYIIFGLGMGQLYVTEATYTNMLGLSFIPFTMTLSGYALGCSIVAMFNRIGGGIYTKAADMGADLVGKTEAHIPEYDPRNPATIADNVGDNVGDVAGLGSDLLESYIGSIVSAVTLAFHLCIASNGKMEAALLEKELEVQEESEALPAESKKVYTLYVYTLPGCAPCHLLKQELDAQTELRVEYYSYPVCFTDGTRVQKFPSMELFCGSEKIHRYIGYVPVSVIKGDVALHEAGSVR